jgi:hypothetical protein
MYGLTRHTRRMPPSPDEVLAAAQAALLGSDAVTDGYVGTWISVVDDDLVVAFRWRLHPREFQVRLPLGDLSAGCWTGQETDTAEAWVNEVAGLLMEELDTGATHWAVRHERDGRVELDLAAGPPTRSGYHVSRVGQTRAAWLTQERLTLPEEALTAQTAGTLRVWLEMYVNNAQGEPVVAHLVISGGNREVVEVAALQVLQDVPLPDLTRLAHHGLCLAAEGGAEQVSSSLHHPALLAAGMQPSGDRLTLDTRAPWPVPAALRQP